MNYISEKQYLYNTYSDKEIRMSVDNKNNKTSLPVIFSIESFSSISSLFP